MNKEHLNNIATIIKTFIKKWNFNTYYLSICGKVSYNIHSSLEVSCNNEFDHLKWSEIKQIKSDLHEQIRSYLELNKINDTIIIDSDREIIIYYKVTEKIRL